MAATRLQLDWTGSFFYSRDPTSKVTESRTYGADSHHLHSRSGAARGAAPVAEVTDGVRQLLDDMVETMYDAPASALPRRR